MIFLGITFHPIQGHSQDDFVTSFLPTWKRATEYLTEVAEAMPEDLYNYTPTPETMTFKEHLIHIAGNILSLHGRYVTPPKKTWNKPDPKQLSKSEVLQELQQAFELIDESLSQITPEELQSPAENFWSPDPTTKKGIFLLIRDHMTHHRGQLVVYLRINNITPPGYRGW